jgi:hypothetical protein
MSERNYMVQVLVCDDIDTTSSGEYIDFPIKLIKLTTADERNNVSPLTSVMGGTPVAAIRKSPRLASSVSTRSSTKSKTKEAENNKKRKLSKTLFTNSGTPISPSRKRKKKDNDEAYVIDDDADEDEANDDVQIEIELAEDLANLNQGNEEYTKQHLQKKKH